MNNKRDRLNESEPIVKENRTAASRKSSFGYFGSKHRIASLIIEHLPPHHAWVDAFCGSCAVTLAKPQAPIEIINDINKDIVNFFKQLRNNTDKLCRNIALTPYGRDELSYARQNGKRVSDLEKARKFLASAMMSVNGVFGEERGGFSYSESYSRSNKEARVSRWYNLPDRITNMVERLRKVRIENKDARNLLRKYLKRPATLVYLDPPYLADRCNGYDHDQNDEKFHKELLKLACTANCMIVISGYDHPLYRSMLKKESGWKFIEIATHTQGSNGKRSERTEILWFNKYCVKAKESKQVPIRLTSREKKLGKLNPIRK